MRAARSWKEFYIFLDRSISRFGDTLQLPFDDAQSMERMEARPLDRQTRTITLEADSISPTASLQPSEQSPHAGPG
jgi:hypothetical protein